MLKEFAHADGSEEPEGRRSNVIYPNFRKDLKKDRRPSIYPPPARVEKPLPAEKVLDEFRQNFIPSLQERLNEIQRLTAEYLAIRSSAHFDDFKYALFLAKNLQPTSGAKNACSASSEQHSRPATVFSQDEIKLFKRYTQVQEDWKDWNRVFREIDRWHHRLFELRSRLDEDKTSITCEKIKHILTLLRSESLNLSYLIRPENVSLFEEFVHSIKKI